MSGDRGLISCTLGCFSALLFFFVGGEEQMDFIWSKIKAQSERGKKINKWIDG